MASHHALILWMRYLWYQYFQIPHKVNKGLKVKCSSTHPRNNSLSSTLYMYFRVLYTEREKILALPYKICVSLDIKQASPFPIRCTIVYWVWCFSFVKWKVLEKVVVVIAIWHYECLEYTEWYVCSVTQSYLTLSDTMDYILPGSSVLGIFQERERGWITSSFSRGSSWPRECISCIGSQILYHWAIWCVS